jgi:peptide deformylase
MAVRPVRLFGDPVLLTPAEPVADFDLQLRNLIRDLTQTLDDAGGSGLAAPQIGVGQRVFVFSVDGVRGHLVNPGLEFPDDEEQDGLEGCLSLPGLYFDVRRRRNVVARGFTGHGDPVQVVGSETLARCLQHEADHLDGVLFTDRMDPATRKEAMRVIRNADLAGQARPRIRQSPHPLSGKQR